MKQATFDTGRLGALSDGVFAIALTLLVLDLKLPEFSEGRSFEEALMLQLPHALSWVLSFAILARLWIVQHALLVHGDTRSRAFMGWTFVFLGAVSVIPFTASLLAERHDHALSVIVFSAVLSIGGIALDRMWCVERDEFDRQARSDARVTSPRVSTIAILVLSVVAGVVALISPTAGPFVWIVYPLSAPWLHRRTGR